LTGGAAAAAAAAHRGAPGRPADRRPWAASHALIDRTVVAQTFAMRREVSEARLARSGPVLEPGWAYGSVIRDRSGLFRMWYMGEPAYTEYYATSRDGIRWERPALDIVAPATGAGSNAFLSAKQKDRHGRWLVDSIGPEGFSVLDSEVEPHPAAKARFTALYLADFGSRSSGEGKGLGLGYSDDGIRWVADERNPIIPGWHDTGNCLMFDARIGKYRIYGRPPVFVSLGRNSNRLLSCMESDDLVHWSSPRTVLETDERDADGLHLTDEGALGGKGESSIRGRDRQFYGMSVFPAAGVYIGLAQIYDVPAGTTWLELCHSRDGLEWQREPLREPFIAPRPGTWERWQVRPAMASPPVRVADEHWIYYSVSPHSHHEGKAMSGRAIACRAMKVDRWVGYRSGAAKGELLTHALESEPRLWLNARIEGDGEVRVAVLDEWGRAIEGFTESECRPIHGDSIRHEVQWGERAVIPAGKPIRLRLLSRNASLYAFSLGESLPPAEAAGARG